jgi:hypothetical protein
MERSTRRICRHVGRLIFRSVPSRIPATLMLPIAHPDESFGTTRRLIELWQHKRRASLVFAIQPPREPNGDLFS